MSRAISVLVSVLLAFGMVLGVANAPAQTVTWTGGGDGTSWSQAANWSSNPVLPGATNDVVIGAGGQAITGNVSPTIRSLSLARNLNLSAANLSFSSGTGITLVGGAVITLNGGNLLFTGGTQSIAGSGEIVSALNNTGSIQANGGCALTIAPGVTCRTDSGATGSSSIAFYMAWDGVTPGTILNQGIIRASGNTARVISFNNNGGTGNAFTNAGSLQATNSGDVTVTANLNFVNNGTLVLNTGGKFSANGSWNSAALGTITRDVAASTLNIGGTFTTGPTFTLSNATGPVNFSCSWSGVAINAINGLVPNFTGGAFNGVVLNSPSTFTGAGATSTGLTVSAAMTMTGSNITFSASGLTLAGAAVVTLNGSNLLFNGGTQSIAGSGEITSALNNSGSIQANGACALTIAPGVICRTDSGNTGSSSIAFYMAWDGVTPGTILNQGVIRASGNANRSISFNNNGGTGNAFTNAGTLEATNNGDLTVNSSLNFVNNGTIVLNTGGKFTCNGTLNAAGGLGTITRDVAASTVNIGGTFITGATFTLSNTTGPVNFSCNWSNVAINAINGLVLNFTGGALNGVTLNSPSTFSGANASSTGLTIAAPSTLTGSNLTFSAVGLTLTGGSVVTLNGSNLLFNGGTQSIAGNGEIVSALNNSASIQANGGCALTIAPGITCRTDSGNTGSSSIAFYMAWNGTIPGTILNQGVIRASGNAARVISFNNNGGTGNAFTNAGTLEATNNGDLTVSANLTFANNGTLVLNTGGRFTSNGILNATSGLGTITRDVAASTINVGGVFTTGPTFTLSNATGPINFSCAWSNVAINAINGLVLNFTGGSFANATINSASTFTGASATSTGLTVSAAMTMTGSNLSFTAGNMTLAGGVIVTLNGSNLLFTGVTQSIAGNGEIVSALNNSASIQANNGCALTI
ncbi:MAG: beta strand repeat-containing protein, partial [Phycisphaerales bacterium]